MITGNKVILREKRLSDVYNDYDWEFDPELAQLDAAPIEPVTFPQYLVEYTHKLRNFSPSSCRFAVDTLDGKHIGNCSYYNISDINDDVELGIMIGNRDHWGNGCGTDTVTTLVNYIFRYTRFKRIYLKTLESNSRAQRCFRKCSFTPCGYLAQDGFSFILMEIHRQQWQEKEGKIQELKRPD
ncbi:GNAT family N-acetyltransferase [Chloroflexota bacterium]